MKSKLRSKSTQKVTIVEKPVYYASTLLVLLHNTTTRFPTRPGFSGICYHAEVHGVKTSQTHEAQEEGIYMDEETRKWMHRGSNPPEAITCWRTNATHHALATMMPEMSVRLGNCHIWWPCRLHGKPDGIVGTTLTTLEPNQEGNYDSDRFEQDVTWLMGRGHRSWRGRGEHRGNDPCTTTITP